MINGKVSDFVDQLYYGQELVFLYGGKKYFIQGWWSEDRTIATLVLEEMNTQPFTGYLWEYQAEEMSKCADAFLSVSLWNGKTFLQIENDVTWIDW
jgi:hypothetical protein